MNSFAQPVNRAKLCFLMCASASTLLVMFAAASCKSSTNFAGEQRVIEKDRDPMSRDISGRLRTRNITGSSADPDPADELRIHCNNPDVVKRLSQTIVFEQPSTSCDWGKNGNLPRRQELISAYRSEYRNLNLPPSALFCDLSLDFSGAGGSKSQPMIYDDEIFILLNGVVLAASKGMIGRMPRIDQFRLFDWSQLVDSPYRSNLDYPVYCVGSETGQGSCNIPFTETMGNIQINIASELVQRIALASGSAFAKGASSVLKSSPGQRSDNSLALGLITIGDDDPNDCKHSTLQIHVEAHYIQ